MQDQQRGKLFGVVYGVSVYSDLLFTSVDGDVLSFGFSTVNVRTGAISPNIENQVTLEGDYDPSKPAFDAATITGSFHVHQTFGNVTGKVTGIRLDHLG